MKRRLWKGGSRVRKEKTNQKGEGRGGGLQDGYVGPNPDIVPDGDWLADAVPHQALVEPQRVCVFSPSFDQPVSPACRRVALRLQPSVALGNRTRGGCCWRREKKKATTRLTSDAHDGAVGPDVAALPNDHVRHGRVHDGAPPIDEGGAADMEPDAVVDVQRRFDKGCFGDQTRVGEGLVVSDGAAIIHAVAVWTHDAREKP